MNKEPQNLWEKEQREEARRRRIQEIKDLLGRENIPRVLRGSTLKTLGADPIKILEAGGYTQLPNRSYVRVLDIIYRYHAYILANGNIQIHTDKTKFMKHRKFHVASEYMVTDEKARLREFIPQFQPIQEEKRKYKNEFLPRDQMQKALAELKAEAEKNHGV